IVPQRSRVDDGPDESIHRAFTAMLRSQCARCSAPAHGRIRRSRSSQNAVRVRVRRVVGEASELALEGQPEPANFAVAVLGKLNLRDALLCYVFLVVDLFAKNQQNHVRILLNAPRVMTYNPVS